MLKIALTGGIATGKSYVLRRLRERGVLSIDADDIVHQALGPGAMQQVFDAIDPSKDVDGVTPINVGRLVQNRAELVARVAELEVEGAHR